MLESCTLVDYAVAALAPNRGVPTHETVFNVPVNYNIIKGGGHIVAYDTGWKQQQYLSAFNCQHWAPVRDQMAPLGIAPEEVDMIVLGHAHWDHAGQVDEFPKATLFVQGEELRYVDWATSYPNPKISETVCGRRPACGYPPDIMDLIFRKIQNGQAHIVEGEETIAPGLTIHPVFKAHTRGSELLQVHTVQGEFVFGSDAYSVWTNIKEFEPANIQQADTVEQVLAYEKGVKIAGGFDHLLSAHEPLSYTEKYPVTSKSWVGANGSRGAELVLAPGEPSRLGRLPAPASSAAGVQTAPPAAVPAAGASAPAASAGGAVPAPAQIPR
jgi:glyoxylase-like metal-dependent hydrolase (beta-lactamase superfamily II)